MFTSDRSVTLIFNYFIMQNNVIAAINCGNYSYEGREKWLYSELSVYFKDEAPTRMMQFGNWIKYIQKM